MAADTGKGSPSWFRALAGLAGLFAGLSFVTAFTIEGWLRAGYDPFGDFISKLSLGPRGWVQIANFMVTGALLMVFAAGVRVEFGTGRASRAGPVLLGLAGLLLFLSGPFVMDPAETPRAAMSTQSIVHWILGALFFVVAPASCLVFLRRFWTDKAWEWLRWWTLGLAAIMVVAVVILRIGPTMPPAPPNAFNTWQGLIQRALVVPFMLWLVLFGAGLFAVNRRKHTE